MYRKILLPVDLAQESSWNRALPVACELARPSNAELHAVTVVPDYGMSIVGSFFPKGYEEQAIGEAKARLKEFLEANVPSDVSVQGHVANGSIYEEILRVATELDCDLIVIASHRPELRDYLLGPNAARVVRHARQSVHVVRD